MNPPAGKAGVFALPKARRHTYHFLQYAEQFKSVYIDTEIDMTAIKRRKSVYQMMGQRVGYTALLMETISRVLSRYPEANVGVGGGLLPRMAQYADITARFTVDKQIDGRRIVLSGVVDQADKQDADRMQQVIDYYRDREVDDIPELKGIRKLQTLPIPLARLIYRIAMGRLGGRGRLVGTFTMTSLGHRPIQAFYPIISSTLCFAAGTTEEKPVVINGKVVIRPIMKLGLAFDHRAIDGALAADILADVKKALELDAMTGEMEPEQKEVSYVGAST